MDGLSPFFYSHYKPLFCFHCTCNVVTFGFNDFWGGPSGYLFLKPTVAHCDFFNRPRQTHRVCVRKNYLGVQGWGPNDQHWWNLTMMSQCPMGFNGPCMRTEGSARSRSHRSLNLTICGLPQQRKCNISSVKRIEERKCATLCLCRDSYANLLH